MYENNLYLNGEEKFGPLSSRFYSFFATFSYQRMYRQVRTKVNQLDPSSILDVGCGPAHILLNLAESFPNLTLFGVDPSPSMVSIARKRIGGQGLENRVSVVPGSSRTLPFDRKFDMIISSLSFHHWKQRESALEHLLGYLANNGTLSVFELNSEKFPGKLPGIKNHTLSPQSAREFVYDGYRTDIETSEDEKVLILNISHR